LPDLATVKLTDIRSRLSNKKRLDNSDLLISPAGAPFKNLGDKVNKSQKPKK